MSELASWRVFEVDRAETQAEKRARVPASDRVRYVAVDFLRDDVAARLREADWDVSSPSLFVWEGVTNYLTEAAVSEVLSWIGRAAAGTTLVFTYIHRGLLDGTARFPGGEKMMQNVRTLGEPWRFGLEPRDVAPFVARFGLTLEEDLGADDYRRRYLGPRARPGYGFYRIAVAVVQNAARPILADQARD
jgi:methyltransferase (TIGR00027 family)